MSKHNFVESKSHGNDFQVVIFCTWCGKVVWDFNRNDKSVKELQQSVKEPCVYKPEEAKKEQN